MILIPVSIPTRVAVIVEVKLVVEFSVLILASSVVVLSLVAKDSSIFFAFDLFFLLRRMKQNPSTLISNNTANATTTILKIKLSPIAIKVDLVDVDARSPRLTELVLESVDPPATTTSSNET